MIHPLLLVSYNLEESPVVVFVVELLCVVVLFTREEVIAQGDAEGALLTGDAVVVVHVDHIVVENAVVVFGRGKGEDAHQSYHQLLLLVVDYEVLCVLGRIDEAAVELLVWDALVVFGAPVALTHAHRPCQRHIVMVVRADDFALLFLPAVAAL